jgi:hypothetical protein
MSTHCYIGYLDSAGRIEVIYIHHDGYYSGVGKMLGINYIKEENVIQLFCDGSRSSLDPIMCKEKNLYYESKHIFNSLEELKEDIIRRKDIEYIYIWKEKTKKWYVFNIELTKLFSLQKIIREYLKYETKIQQGYKNFSIDRL